MRNSTNNSQFVSGSLVNFTQRYIKHLYLPGAFILLLVFIALLQFPFTKIFIVQASSSPKTESASLSENISVHAPLGGNSAISFANGHDLISIYSGNKQLQQAVTQGQAKPLALASADFDEDGVPDLVCGYASSGGNMISLHRGNSNALYTNSPTAKQQRVSGSLPEAPFLSAAQLFALPEAAEFIGTGDFDADGHWDLVTATRNSNKLFFLLGDGHGEFQHNRQIPLSGTITALLSGDINRRDGLDDLVVGVNNTNGAQALVFEGPRGVLAAAPEILELSDPATSFAIGRLYNNYTIDLAIATGHELLIMQGRDRHLSLSTQKQALTQTPQISKRSFQSSLRAIAIGDFSGNQSQEIALLLSEGSLQVISGQDIQETNKTSISNIAQWNSKTIQHGLNTETNQLISARLSSLPQDNLLLVNNTVHQVQIVTNNVDSAYTAATALPEPVSSYFDVEGETAALLPMRLNEDALSDLVVLKSGVNPLAIVTTQVQSSFIVINTNDQGAGSFRQAILDANANPGADLIRFQIPGSSIPTISPLSPLPDFTEAITIDGTTQSAGKVELNGAQVQLPDPLPDGRLVIALRLKGGNSVIRGLVINRFSYSKTVGESTSSGCGCIYLAEHGNNIIEGNFLGVDSSGTKWFDTSRSIFTFSGSGNNLIGGTTVAARNVIFGEIQLFYDGNNKVQGNLIGTNANGTAHLRNDKISVDSTEFITIGITIHSPNNLIGGTTAGAQNTISIQNSVGILLSDSLSGPGTPAAPHKTIGNLVQGNLMGTDISGTLPLGLRAGISSQGAAFSIIGGTTSGARNIVSSCLRIGIDIISANDTAGGTLIQGNYVGTDKTGIVALGNATGGIPANEDTPYRPSSAGVRINVGSAVFAITPTNEDIIIGGAIPEARNVISGNKTHGVVLWGAVTSDSARKGIQVQNNYIGTDASGTKPLGNGTDGIFVGANALNIAIKNNLIAFNERAGINIPDPDGLLPGTRISLSANAIYSNQALGIDIGNSGVTDNDSLDADFGANNLQNFPVLSSAAASNTNITINGTINSTASTTLTLQFFVGTNHKGPQLTDSAPGFLGEKQVTTDSNGNASFIFTFVTTDDKTDSWVNATATDATGNTSEFSDCLKVTKSNCTFSLAVANQSFKSSGGTGSVNVNTGNDCFWAATSKANWITVISNENSKGAGTVSYSVAAYTGTEPRVGILTIAEQDFTITQTGTGPVITSVTIQGKHLIVRGENFDSGAVILLDGERQKTIRDETDLTFLKGKKVALKIPSGQRVKIQVRNSNEVVSPIIDFIRPNG
jgi:hypothetical protein